MLENFLKIQRWQDLYSIADRKDPHIVLTRSRTGFMGKAIQGFMRLWQWIRGSRDTSHVPNHADAMLNNYAIGALMFGVDGNQLDAHFSGSAEFFVIKPIFSHEEATRFWYFMKLQEGDSYAYWDLVKFGFNSFLIWMHWKEEPLDRVKWTCFSLVASAVNYAKGFELFRNPWKISPYDFCATVDSYYNVHFEEPKEII